MKMNFITKSLSVLAAVFVLSSCEKDFLDVNTDPNNPSDATPELLLPTALGYTAYDLGNPFQIGGGIFAQYWTQGTSASQYLDYEQYRLTVSDFNRAWNDIYSGPVTDLKTLVAKGQQLSASSEDVVVQARGRNYAAIGYIMQAYVFQLMTDQFGDIPFSQAGRGVEFLNPAYEPQEQIYDSLIRYVDRGLALMDMESDGHPGADDLFYSGDMSMWYKFANTLKLRIYLRQIYVRPDIARTGIAAMYSNPDIAFLEAGETAQVNFENGTQFNRNPLYQSIDFLGVGNLIASNTVLNHYLNTNDPRVEHTFVPATTGSLAGQFAGLNQGRGVAPPRPTNSATDFALPGPEVGGAPSADPSSGATAPVIFLADYESYFLQAEAAARGLAGKSDAKSLYEQGIAASFDKYGLTVPDTFLTQSSVAFPSAGDEEAKVRAIITQKWVAMTGIQNIEAWTEYRRTNYPDFLIVSEAAVSGNGQKPARLPYASDEQSRNSSFPGLKDIFEKVWWDVN